MGCVFVQELNEHEGGRPVDCAAIKEWIIFDEAQALLKYYYFYPSTERLSNKQLEKLPIPSEDARPLLSRYIMLVKKNLRGKIFLAGTRARLQDLLSLHSSMADETAPSPYLFNFDYLCARKEYFQIPGLLYVEDGVSHFLR